MKLRALELGFAKAGVAPAVTPLGLHRFYDWLDAGYAGEMRYLADRKEAYASPSSVLAGARSILMLALPYGTQPAAIPQPGEGRISNYAWGAVDYHDLIHRQLKILSKFLQEEVPGAKVRGVVDSAPLLEREFAQLAGIGWIGKNTMLIDPALGSYFFLAALLTDCELELDEPFAADHCGTCRACLDACPTDAFPAAGVLDATRCISYLTIELRGELPVEQRNQTGDWLFGCDICQQVCPWNSHAPQSLQPEFQPKADANPMQLANLFQLDEAAFRHRFRKTPLWRAKRRGILRNAALVLCRQAAHVARPPLELGSHDPDELVANTCDWALSQISD